MPKRINVQSVGLVDFPDTMTDEQIQEAIETEILKIRPPTTAKSAVVQAPPPPSMPLGSALDRVIRSGGSVRGVSPAIVGGSVPTPTVRLQSSDWEKAVAAQADAAFDEQRRAVPQAAIDTRLQREIENTADGMALQAEVNARRSDAPSGAGMVQFTRKFGKAVQAAMPDLRQSSDDPAVRLKNALQMSEADGGAEALRILEEVDEAKRQSVTQQAVDLARRDIREGLAQFVPPPVEGEPGMDTAAKAFSRTLLGLASPQGVAEAALFGAAGKGVQSLVNAAPVARALQNAPRVGAALDAAAAAAVPGGMAVVTGANAIQAGGEALKSDNETERIDKLTSAVTNALLSAGLLRSAAKKAGGSRAAHSEPMVEPEYDPSNPIPLKMTPAQAEARATVLESRGERLAANTARSQASDGSTRVSIGDEIYTIRELPRSPGSSIAGAEVYDKSGKTVFGGTAEQARNFINSKLQPSISPTAADPTASPEFQTPATQSVRAIRPLAEARPASAVSSSAAQLTPAQRKLLDVVDPSIVSGRKPKTMFDLREQSGLEPAEFDEAFRGLWQTGAINANRGDQATDLMLADGKIKPGEFVLDQNSGRPFVSASRSDEWAPEEQTLSTMGRKAEAGVAKGYRVPVQYGVIEVGDAVTSHDDLLNPNNAYPQERQPRQRDRGASMMQIQGIIANLFPAQLGVNAMASDGSPVLDPDGNIVESGNGRMIALRKAYAAYPQQAQKYRDWLLEEAPYLGIGRSAIAGMKQPVLVRFRGNLPQGVDARQFGVDANEDSKAQMNATERAMADAQQMDDEILALFVPGQTGAVDTAENIPFASAFLSRIVSPGEMGNLIGEDNKLSKEGAKRLKYALFAKAYKDPSAMQMLGEDSNSTVANLINGMFYAAPRMAKVTSGIERGNLHQLDISTDISRAVHRIENLRFNGTPVSQYLQQVGLHEEDLVHAQLMSMFDAYKRSPRRIGEVLTEYANGVIDQGDPQQPSMFGPSEVASKPEILKAAIDVVARRVEDAKPKPTGTERTEAGSGGSPEIQDGAGLPATGTSADTGTVAPAAESAVTQPSRRRRFGAAAPETPSPAPAPQVDRRPKDTILLAAMHKAARPLSITEIVEASGLPASDVVDRMARLAEAGKLELLPSTPEASWAEPQEAGRLQGPDGTQYYGARLSVDESARQSRLASRRRSQRGAANFFTGLQDPSDPDPTDPEFRFSDKEMDEVVQKRIQEAGKPTQPKPQESWLRQWGRVYRHIPNGVYPVLVFNLKRLEKASAIASSKAQEAIRSITLGLKKNQFKAFRLRVVLDDMVSTIDQFIKDGKIVEDEIKEIELAFGFTLDKLRIAQQEIVAFTDSTPGIRRAIDRREQVWESVRGDFLQAMDRLGIDMRGKFSNKNYFRHLVLVHMVDNEAGSLAKRPGVDTPRRASHFIARIFNTLDYSTNYVEAEYQVLSQLIADTQKARMIDYLKNPANGLNIIEDLKKQARAANVQAAIDHFRSKGAPDSQIYAMANWGRETFVETLGQLAYGGALPDDGGRFASIIKDLASAYESALLEDEGSRMKVTSSADEVGAYVSWVRQYLAENPADSSRPLTDREVLMRRTVTSMTNVRRLPSKLLKQILKDRMVKWSDLIPDTHKEWTPETGNTFFAVTSIPESLAMQIMESVTGLEEVSRDDLRKVLALGPKKEPLVLPKEVAKTLDDLRTEAQKSRAYQVARKALGHWKSFQLISPGRFFKYNARNLSGDLEATLAGNPAALKRVPEAAGELYNWYRNREMSPALGLWMDRGGFQSSLTVQEMGDLQNDKRFRELMEVDGKLPRPGRYNPWKLWEENIGRPASEFREAIMRYANFLQFLDEARKGPITNYAASRPSDVDALKAAEDKAYKLSNDLLGAYDEITEGGRFIRDLLIPFWSFQELNFRRFKWLIKNAAKNHTLASALGRKLMGKAVFRAPYIAYRIGVLYLKIMGLWALLQAWNQFFWADEEQQLPKSVRSRPHIVLGRDDRGQVQYFSRLGNLPDVLEWVDPDDYAPLARDFFNGKITLQDFALKAAQHFLETPVEKVATTGLPYVSIPTQLAMGKRWFPDITNPRPIRDKWEFMAEQLQLQQPYRLLTGKPTGPEGSAIPDAIRNVFVYSADPKETAYYDIRDLRTEFLTSKGVDDSAPGSSSAPRKEAAYNMKVAVRRKDLQAFKTYLQQYLDNGGTRETLRKSAETFHPLYKMSAARRKEFSGWLKEDDKARLDLAIEYYKETFGSGRLNEFLAESRDIRKRR